MIVIIATNINNDRDAVSRESKPYTPEKGENPGVETGIL
jgi:hypothetical protein